MSPIFGHVSAFWMSFSRKFACRLFWLKQELRTVGEQVRYFKIHVGLVAFRPNARGHSRPHHSTINRDGRMVAEMSRDRKYRVYTLNNVLWNKHINDRGPNAWWFYDTRKDINRLFHLEHTYKRISHILMICWSA